MTPSETPDIMTGTDSSGPPQQQRSQISTDTVIEQLAPVASRGFLYVLFITLVLAVAWATYSRVDVVATSPGRVIPLGEIVRIPAPIAGQLSSILVAAGEHVESGQPVFHVDPFNATAQLDRANDELTAANRELDEVRNSIFELEIILREPAHRLGATIAATSNSEVAAAIAQVAHSYLQMVEARAVAGDTEAGIEIGTREAGLRNVAGEAEQGSLRAALASAEAELASARESERSAKLAVDQSREASRLLEEQLEREKRNARQVADEARIYEDLARSGVVARLQAAERTREAEARAGEVVRITANLNQARIEIGRGQASIAQQAEEIRKRQSEKDRIEEEMRRTRAERDRGEQEYGRRATVAAEDYKRARDLAVQLLNKFSTEIRLKEARLATLRTDVGFSRGQLERTTVLAPVTGTITFATAHHAGEYVQPGNPVLTIASDSARLVADIRVANRDFSRIRVGQTVKFKFEAFPFGVFGSLTGRVLAIHPDVQPESNDFRVVCDFDRHFFVGKSGPEPIAIGMGLTADIKLDERRIIDYLIEPLRKLSDKFHGGSG